MKPIVCNCACLDQWEYLGSVSGWIIGCNNCGLIRYTQDDGVAKMKIDLNKLGLRGEQVLASDAFSRLVWTDARNELTVSVKSLDFRLIWVESLAAVADGKARMIASFPAFHPW